MSKNALALFSDAKLPAHVAGFLDEESNIAERQSVNAIGISGKVFSISLNGETKKITKRDDEGEEIPVANLPVVILDYAKSRGRALYEQGYDSANTKPPVCWSNDGEAPDPTVKEPASSKCATCPMAAKGSRVTDGGKAMAACGQHRMVVVAPANMLDTPLRLKLPVTSDWDGDNAENEAKGFFAFKNYTDLLRSRGVKHTAALITMLKFDQNKEYPKLLFSPRRWLEGDELAAVKATLKSGDVAKLLNGFTPDGIDGKEKDVPAPKMIDIPADDEDDVPPPPKKASAKIETKSQIVVDDEDDEDEAPKVKAKPAKMEAKPKAAKKPVDNDNEDDEPVSKKSSQAVSSDVKDLLDEWD